ncbi:glycosyltransferase family 2 protein [Rhodopirellula sp. MGV]|uniref:glycosyltransferase family 2 protein n=1 Tax=Rhodopirellula sp. MGV TaxID=2023130 RepID=UPI000B970517|nr:glycosyltransferase [Rhodopirellula sp. MGV]OYP33003.1 hypothetical protein CGZ80_19130 [Rhodopirellula sp. MGV]PNY35336.1 hypothetical protein C2E31_17565 [Rhodopirellula baltica]
MNPAEPLVSVVIPCYNAERFLKDCVTSVLEQTYASIEVILVDDGSKDRTAAVISELSADQRVRGVSKTNGGAASARNTGMAASRGDFIAFLDSDDLWLHDKLEKQMQRFASADVAIVYSSREDIDENGHVIPSNPLESYRGHGLAGQLLIKNFVPMSSSVMRREVFESIGNFNTTYARSEDLEFWLRAAVDFGFDFVAEPLVRHRRWSEQLTQNKTAVFESSLEIQRDFMARFPHAVTRRDARRGWAKRYNGRGKARALNGQRISAIADFARSLLNDPLFVPAYKNAFKACLGRLSP